MNTAASSIDRFVFRGRTFFIKRDDLIDPLLSGNKYRKLYSLIQTPARQYDTIMSNGGTQSNAMLSIAALCHQKGWSFHYTTKPVSSHLKNTPIGNFKKALALNMQLHEVEIDAYQHAILTMASQTDDRVLYVPQGGACPLAANGINVLAEEIKQWQDLNAIEKLNIVTPSGTGTTACYLAAALPNATILTTAVVGDKAYLLSQLGSRGEALNNVHILETSTTYRFAKPNPELLSIYLELKAAGIEFDLVYAAKMWIALTQHLDDIDGSILYVHSGGLFGNASMLERYRYAMKRTARR